LYSGPQYRTSRQNDARTTRQRAHIGTYALALLDSTERRFGARSKAMVALSGASFLARTVPRTGYF
jgi:hypothetical protein